MSTPSARRGRTTLTSSDPCPRGCNSGPNSAIHLLSDHVEEKARHCSKCACVIQDTNGEPR